MRSVRIPYVSETQRQQVLERSQPFSLDNWNGIGERVSLLPRSTLNDQDLTNQRLLVGAAGGGGAVGRHDNFSSSATLLSNYIEEYKNKQAVFELETLTAIYSNLSAGEKVFVSFEYELSFNSLLYPIPKSLAIYPGADGNLRSSTENVYSISRDPLSVVQCTFEDPDGQGIYGSPFYSGSVICGFFDDGTFSCDLPNRVEERYIPPPISIDP